MKKLGSVIIITLALNFLAVAGGVGWLFSTGKLSREKIAQIKEVIFPKAQPSVELATTQPSADPTTKPIVQLEELLARKTGQTARETVDFIQQTFDAQMVQLDRRRREIDDLQKQIELAKQQLGIDREELEKNRTELASQREESERLASDQGFQDSLALYQALPGKQVKDIFITLEDEVVVRYLQNMSSTAAKKILKEYKSPDEKQRATRIMEKMRLPTASAKE